MKVTICVPIYGVENYIERCARSLFEQTYNDIEYIFVNDCTKDKSIEILRQVIEEYPSRKGHIRILSHEQNRGLAATRNTAVKCCDTEFLMHVDSDDWIDRDAVEACVKNLSETNADIVTIGPKRIYDNKESAKKITWTDDVHEMTKRIILRKAHINVWGRLIRTSLYKEHGIRVEVGKGQAEDVQVIPRLFYYSKKATFVDSVFYNYVTRNKVSYSASFSLEKFFDSRKAYKVLTDFFSGKDEELLKAVKQRETYSLAKYLIQCAKADAGEDVYIQLKSCQDDDTFKHVGLLVHFDRIALYINSYALMRVYVKIKKGIKIRKRFFM